MRKKWDKTYREKNAEKIREKNRAWRENNLEKERERGRLKYRKAKENNPERLKKYWREFSKTIKGKFNSYKKNAKSRGMEFQISLDEFSELWEKPCQYCGSRIETIGVDRVDNSRGYTKDNIVACCRKCNHMKKNLTVEEFINHCRKVIKHSYQQAN